MNCLPKTLVIRRLSDDHQSAVSDFGTALPPAGRLVGPEAVEVEGWEADEVGCRVDTEIRGNRLKRGDAGSGLPPGLSAMARPGRAPSASAVEK